MQCHCSIIIVMCWAHKSEHSSCSLIQLLAFWTLIDECDEFMILLRRLLHNDFHPIVYFYSIYYGSLLSLCGVRKAMRGDGVRWLQPKLMNDITSTHIQTQATLTPASSRSMIVLVNPKFERWIDGENHRRSVIHAAGMQLTQRSIVWWFDRSSWLSSTSQSHRYKHIAYDRQSNES